MMPIYEWQCQQCGCVIERYTPTVFFTDLIIGEPCGACGGEVRRVPSVTVVGHVGLKKEAARIDARMKVNAAKRRARTPRR